MRSSGPKISALLGLLALLTACVGGDRPASEAVVLLNLGDLRSEPPPPKKDDPPRPPDVVKGVQEAGCRVDVGRSPETVHPKPALQEFVMALNEKARAITGLPVDVFIGGIGGKYVVNCILPHPEQAALVDTNTGAAIIPMYQMRGMPPRNYRDYISRLERPNLTEVPKRPIQLLPPVAPGAAGPSKDLATAISQLPPPGFAVDPLLTVLPTAQMNIAPGIYQINQTLRFEMNLVATNLENLPPDVTADVALAPHNASLNFRAIGEAGVDLCQWTTAACPEEVRAPPIQERCIDPEQCVLEPLQKLVDARKAAGQPMTMSLFAELTQYDSSGWLNLQYQGGGINYALFVTEGLMEAEGGGCGCRIGGAMPLHTLDTGIALVLLVIGGLFMCRRRMTDEKILLPLG